MPFSTKPRKSKPSLAHDNPARFIIDQLPLFWRFQIAGWLAFVTFSIPLNWVVLPEIPSPLMFSATRDGLGFFLTLGMREIYRRVYARKPGPITIALIASIVSISGGVALTLFSVDIHNWFYSPERADFTSSVLFAIFYFRTAVCGGWSLLYFAIKIMRDSMAWETTLAHRETEKQQMELRMLRAQMNPHFLFNALNTISAAIGKPNQHPIELIQALADYLRYSLKNRDADLVPLGDELDAISAFLAVEQARFREELVIESDVEPVSREKLVPGILVQPLIENAIKHGKKTSPHPLRIRLRVFCTPSEVLRIEIWNTGQWIEPTVAKSEDGVGMMNLRKRLDILYQGKRTIDVTRADGWVCVSVELPIS